MATSTVPTTTPGIGVVPKDDALGSMSSLPIGSVITDNSDGYSQMWHLRRPDYTYHDYSQEEETTEELEDDDQDASTITSTSTAGCAKKRKSSSLNDLPFPVKLHDVLTHAHMEGLTEIITWQNHGRSFTIHDPNRFRQEIMSQWFRQSKYHSFQRQLNLYGFRRLSAGMDRGCYYHELFLRDRRFLAKRMKRTKIKGMGRQPYTPDLEPNFYELPYLSPVGTAAAAKASREASAAMSDDLSDLESTSNVTGTSSLGQLLPEYQRRFIRATTTSSWLTERQRSQSCGTVTTTSISTSASRSSGWAGVAHDLPNLNTVICSSNVLDREVQCMHAEQQHAMRSSPRVSSESSEASSSRSTSPSVARTAVNARNTTSHEAELIDGALSAVASYFDYSAPWNKSSNGMATYSL